VTSCHWGVLACCRPRRPSGEEGNLSAEPFDKTVPKPDLSPLHRIEDVFQDLHICVWKNQALKKLPFKTVIKNESMELKN
jgi:hypothetical protein